MTPIKFKDFVLENIKEEYENGYSFGSTFGGDNCTELTSIELTFTSNDYSIKTITIEPYRAGGYYGGYHHTGKGLSSDILTNLINLIIDGGNITEKEFVDYLVERYAKPYIMTIKEGDVTYLPINTLILSKEDNLGCIQNPEVGTIIFENEIEFDADSTEIIYTRNSELEVIFNNIYSQASRDLIDYYTKTLNTDELIQYYIRNYSNHNLVVVNPSYDTRDIEKSYTLRAPNAYQTNTFIKLYEGSSKH